MKELRILMAALILTLCVHGVAQGQCSTETEQSRRLVLDFATRYGPRTRPAGVPVVDSLQVRLMTNATDAAACQRLYDGWMAQRRDPQAPVEDRQVTSYQVGTQYFVVVTRTSRAFEQNPDGTLHLRLGWIPILVFNAEFQHVVTVAR